MTAWGESGNHVIRDHQCATVRLRNYKAPRMLEIYVSTDVETNGPVAGKHSILSIGSAAYTAEKEMLSTFSANLETLPNAPPRPLHGG